MSYTIGSFNVLKLSNQTNKEIQKDYNMLAQIIIDERFDVVALQEVLSEDPIKNSLIPALGSNKWKYKWASPKPFSTSSAEGYAYIWNEQKLRLVDSNDNPKIYNQYRIQGSRLSGSDKKLIDRQGLIRPPYVARFTPAGLLGGSNFEIRLINTHIVFGKPSNAEMFMAEPSMGDVSIRKQELQTLSECIYRMVSTKRYGNNLPAYTFLLGDYNLCLCGTESKMDHLIRIDDSRQLRTVQEEKTSLKEVKKNEDSMGFQDYYAHNYDHFSYETGLDQKLRMQVSRVDALSTYYNNDLETYRKKISDHVPIKLVLSLTLRERLRSNGI